MSNKAPSRPVFGVGLEELFARDQSAVPMVVYQCMQAVDLFGLEVEGIYRMSGTASHVNTLRDAFNNNAPNLDFRNPANFHHDVNSVATLLKQFFRDLPDPLFTSRAYDAFINAARVDDPGARRDALHQQINDLPDPNYATLRALVLHLHRVMQNEGRNRMGSSNLAICFAYVLLHPIPYTCTETRLLTPFQQAKSPGRKYWPPDRGLWLASQSHGYDFDQCHGYL
jgi:hypothetical protein